jgi:cell filamentation protein, protein adenylyltransferase
MELQKRRRGRRAYYYLVHSYREGQKIRKIERYLGAKPPSSLAQLKDELSRDLITRQWGGKLESIRIQYESNLERMPASIRAKELETFAIRFTYDSNRIEGSSLTFYETAELLDHGVTPSHRPLSDVLEALAHRSVFLATLSPRERLDLPTFLAWHRDLFRETKPEYAGLVRTFQVAIRGSSSLPPPASELDLLLQEFFDWYRRAARSLHPVILAALVHLKLVTIHPFGDGNGRVTRIAMNHVLHAKGFPMLDIPYNGRAGYYRALERSQTAQDEFVFVRWLVRRYLSEYSRTIDRKARAGVPRRSGSNR